MFRGEWGECVQHSFTVCRPNIQTRHSHSGHTFLSPVHTQAGRHAGKQARTHAQHTTHTHTHTHEKMPNKSACQISLLFSGPGSNQGTSSSQLHSDTNLSGDANEASVSAIYYSDTGCLKHVRLLLLSGTTFSVRSTHMPSASGLIFLPHRYFSLS